MVGSPSSDAPSEEAAGNGTGDARRQTRDLRIDETLDQIADGLVFFDRDWRYTYLNRAAEDFLGLSADEILGRTLWEVFPDAATNEFGEPLSRAMNEGETTYVRAFHSKIDRWLETRTFPTASGIAVHMRDVSDVERQQRELDEAVQSALRLTAMLDISNEAIIADGPDYRVTYWNSGAESTYGWTRDEALGRDIRDLIYDDTSRFDEAVAELTATDRWTGDMRQRTKDGRPIIVACRWQTLRDDQGELLSYFAVNSDVTLMREQQALQSRASRLESLGTLAGGLAHDLNNVLTPVLMSIPLLRAMKRVEDQSELLDGMESAVTRGAEMIKQVLSFARGVHGAREVIHAADLLDELRRLTLAVLPKSIDVHIDQAETPPMFGDATQILQVLTNIVANARDAMPEGGTLRISVAEHVVDAASGSAAGLSPGPYVALAVEDSGVGMSVEVQNHIFEPFFTTKGIGEGTGLGLASSHAIARSHGGDLRAVSAPGAGTRFTLYLPVAGTREHEELPPVLATDSVPRGDGELVLVVDDEASIRSVVCQTLDHHGYRTLQAGNGREAIEVLESHGTDVRVVFTDMMMPVMDGPATAAYIAEHHPAVAVVASSGLNAAAAVDRARLAGVSHFIAKPFTTETLLRMLREVLKEQDTQC